MVMKGEGMNLGEKSNPGMTLSLAPNGAPQEVFDDQKSPENEMARDSIHATSNR